MITLQRPDSRVSALMGENKGIKQGDEIRPSQFAVPFNLGDQRVVLNTLTDHVIETERFSWFEKEVELVYDQSDREMMELVKSDFLVAKDCNDAARYYGMIPVLRKMERHKNGYTGYTVLPTTECNARCVYCYERELDHETMSDETVEQTIRYIFATRREDAPVGFHWFGGEPLIGEKIIDRICEAMRDADVKYTSNMISNGSLMTEELAAKAKEDWHLKNIQITLDGREEVYCERKRYIAFWGSPYRAVINGIHALLDQDIRVSIRLNVDEENIDELMALADELESEFKDNRPVSVYCHGIFADDNGEGNSDQLYAGISKLNQRLEIFNRRRRKNMNNREDVSQKPIDDGNIEWETDQDRCPEDEEVQVHNDARSKGMEYYDRRGNLRRYYCMVDSPMAGPVILPSGRLTLCEHIGVLPEVGSVYNEGPVRREDYVERDREKIDKCRRCPLLPLCTDFTVCPTIDRDCVREKMEQKKRELQEIGTEDRLPPVKVRLNGKVVRVTEPTRQFIEENRDSIIPYYIKAEETVSCDDFDAVSISRGWPDQT